MKRTIDLPRATAVVLAVLTHLAYAPAMPGAPDPDWMLPSGIASTSFGFSVASAGDVNGDGYDDLIVGAYGFDHPVGPIEDAGAAALFLGSASGPVTPPAWVVPGNDPGARLGWSVASAGDVNGDGYDDVIVGAPYQYSDGNQTGAARVYHGSATGLRFSHDWMGTPGVQFSRYGNSVASAGDVNGDGHDDVIVGAPHYTDGQDEEGAAFLYLGSASGLASAPAWMVQADQENAKLGFSVAGGADVNGDGFDDLIVGAPGWDGGQADEGAVLVYHGSASGPGTAPDRLVEAGRADTWLGIAVSAAGDVNGDGYDDAIAGAMFFTRGQFHEGGAGLWLGSPAGLPAAPAWAVESNQSQSQFGMAVAGAGDVNHDGYADILVGAVAYDQGTRGGIAVLYLGGASGPSASPSVIVTGNRPWSSFGASVAGAGDVNGDGVDDVTVGSPGWDGTYADEGAVFLYLGR